MTLSIENLHIEYPGQLVFDSVTLDVTDDEIVAIETEVLDGGTSLLKGIAGFLNGVAGTVRFEGTNLLDEPGDETLFKVGFVYEDHGLVSLYDVRQNISLPLQFHTTMTGREIDEAVREVCDRVGIDASLFDRRPHRLNDVQARLVNLARALVVKPRLLLIDELEGGMSDEMIGDTMQVLRTHQKEHPLAIIITTGSEVVTKLSDRVFRIENHGLVPVK